MTKTFDYQGQLKSLPLSNLNDASKNFLEWVQPLLSEDEYEKTKENLNNFNQNEGLVLEEKLNQWSLQNNGNWLVSLWKDMYLEIREPLAIDVNYFVKIITKELKQKYSSYELAGFIISKLADTYEEITSHDFEPEKIGTHPLCMSFYEQMFKATRVAKNKKDEYIVKPKTNTNHIIIMHKNRMFKLDLEQNSLKKHSCKVISKALENLASLDYEAKDLSIGLITLAFRDEASIVLEEIVSNNQNNQNFEVLKEALFVVCMDEESKNLKDFGMSLIASNESNRYFDKSMQLIFNKNGDFGFNFEHTSADGGTWINIVNKVYKQLENIDSYIKKSNEKSNDTSINTQAQELQWDFSKQIEEKLYKIKQDHQRKTSDLNMQIIYNKNLGTKKIKALKYSPDAFLHLALQLAQYRTFGKLRSTYEAVSTRNYLYGRTECNRPISNEVLEFVKAFDEKNINDEHKENLKQMMTKACKKHSSRIKDCLGSNGVERYFFALFKMYELFKDELNLKNPPLFFEDNGYKKLSHSFISTSRIESKYFDLGGFGPVVSDGFAFWYNLLENRIDMNLLTYKSVNEKYIHSFKEQIMKALEDLEKLASS